VLADALDDTPQTAAYINHLDEQLREQSSPAVLNPDDPRNPITEAKRSMEQVFASLEERGVQNPGKLSEYSLYSRLEYYRKQSKE